MFIFRLIILYIMSDKEGSKKEMKQGWGWAEVDVFMSFIFNLFIYNEYVCMYVCMNE